MITIYGCLVETHDLRLVAVAGLVCVIASLTTFHLFPRMLAKQERASANVWLFLTSTMAACGIWATHFIAMLAFNPALPIAFEPSETVVSLIVAVLIVATAFSLLLASPRRAVQLAAGVLLGLATVAMHYTGVAGLRVAGAIVWTPSLVALSVLASVLFAAPALFIAVNGKRGGHRVFGAGLFALSIVSLHFTGMSAITIVPNPAVDLPDGLLSGERLGYGIAAVSLLIACCAIAAWVIDRRSRFENQKRLLFLARHDSLTALPNRLLFEEIVKREMAASAIAGRQLAMLCIDLDGFKEVNDLFGHPAGDSLLVQVANRLQELLGERCVAARLGGDEFAVLAAGLGRFKTPGTAAQSIVETLGAPFTVEGNRIDIGCSIGISIFPDNGDSYSLLLSNADVALGRAKAQGKGAFRFFEPAMDAALRERRQLAHDLRAAVGTDQLHLHYQRQFDLATNRVSGFEALLRWNHPTAGRVSPEIFIAIAEETGLILPIGEWVLREACREAATWGAPLNIAVNLSIAQFKLTGLPELVRAVLAETGLSANRLELEVTESLFIDNAQRALQTLQQIKTLGVRISMDDFGTGYSSLATLMSFPFDKLKVDRSFTTQIGVTRKGTAIVKAVLALGDSLDMMVTAEGVETEEQLRFLREQHCAQVQGYICGRPAPIEEQRSLTALPANNVSVVQLRRA